MNSAPPTALIVEDQRFNRTLLRHTLASLHFTTVEAINGDEALRLLGGQTFDVVFLDWELPGINKGDRVAREIRATPQHAHTLLIAITTDTSEAMRQRCANAGTDAFLGKALDAANVQSALNVAAKKRVDADRVPAASNNETSASFDKITSRMRVKLADYARYLPGGLPAALESCRSELTLEQQRLHAASASAAWADAARAAHNIRSLAAMLDLGEIHETAIAAENTLRACDALAAQAYIAKLDSLLEQTCRALTLERA